MVELQKYKWWCEKDGKDTKITELQLPKKIRKNESSKITLFVSYCMHKTIHRSYQEGVFSPHVPSSFGALTYRNIEISNRDILLTLLFNNHVSSIYNLYLQRRLHPPPPNSILSNYRWNLMLVNTYPRFHNILIPSLIFQVTDTAENTYYSPYYKNNNKVQIDQIIFELFCLSSSLYLLSYIDQGGVKENQLISLNSWY